MLHRITRLGVLGTLFMFAGATAASADELLDDAGFGCADYISSGAYDKPLEGHLLYVAEVEVSISSSNNTGASVGGGAVPASASASTGEVKTVKERYEVGYYRMSDGTTLRIDCRTYTYAL